MASASVSRLQLLATAILFSTGGAAIKATGFTGWQVASFRSLIAAAAIILLVPEARRSWSWRTGVVGVAYASTLALYVLANKMTTAANATFLQYTAPVYLVLLGPFVLRERIRRSDLMLMAVLAAGMALFFVGRQEAQRTAPDPVAGNIVAVFSGVSWALTIAGLRWIEGTSTGGQPGMAAVVAGNTTAGLLCLSRALPVAGAAAADWMVVAYLGVFQIGVAYAFMTRAMRRIPALEASLLLLAEPALNPVWAWIVHGERSAPLAVLGGALILAATLARTLMARSR